MWTFVRRTCLEGKGDVGLHAMVQMPANRYGGIGGLDKLRAGKWHSRQAHRPMPPPMRWRGPARRLNWYAEDNWIKRHC